ncbi:MAG: biotin/lipoyl-containing protein, partial [Alphaproteobacteria bacterium]
MAVEIKMPALSPTMESGTLAKWNVAVGDEVRSGDVIAEIETDKATMEVEAVDEGIVAAIVVDAGAQNVAVGAVIAVLAEDGEDVATAAATPVSATPASASPPVSQADKPEAAPSMPSPSSAPGKAASKAPDNVQVATAVNSGASQK